MIDNNIFLQEDKIINNYQVGNDTLLSVKRRLLMGGIGDSLKAKIR